MKDRIQSSVCLSLLHWPRHPHVVYSSILQSSSYSAWPRLSAVLFSEAAPKPCSQSCYYKNLVKLVTEVAVYCQSHYSDLVVGKNFPFCTVWHRAGLWLWRTKFKSWCVLNLLHILNSDMKITGSPFIIQVYKLRLELH